MKTSLIILILLVLSDLRFAFSQTDPIETPKSQDLKLQEYDYQNHNDFKLFYEDFKKAVNAKDKEAVLKMINIPFLDYFNDFYHKDRSFTSIDTIEFLSNYDKIFNDDFKTKFNSNEYVGWTKEDYDKAFEEDMDLLISEGEYMLCANYADLLCFVFDMLNGKYKLSYIAYYP